jgi:hypothetical protein
VHRAKDWPGLTVLAQELGRLADAPVRLQSRGHRGGRGRRTRRAQRDFNPNDAGLSRRIGAARPPGSRYPRPELVCVTTECPRGRFGPPGSR